MTHIEFYYYLLLIIIIYLFKKKKIMSWSYVQDSFFPICQIIH